MRLLGVLARLPFRLQRLLAGIPQVARRGRLGGLRFGLCLLLRFLLLFGVPGMDPDEVLRLTQITGLAEAFKDRDFSEAWEAVLDVDDEDTLEVIADA